MLSKKSYREVVKGLDHYRLQHELDRKDYPNAIPSGWKSSLLMMIENIVRKNHERYHKDQGIETLEYLVTQKLLIRYHGDYTFPDTVIPTREELDKHIEQNLKEYGIVGTK